jgi:hypothetical protein
MRVSSVGIISAEQQTAAASTTIAASVLQNSGSDTNASSYTSGTFSGTSGRLWLIAVVHQTTSGASSDLSSITGTPLSGAVKIASVAYGASSAYRVSMWAAAATGTSSTITLNFGGTIGGCRFTVVEFTNVNTALGTLGVIQSNTNTDGGSGTTSQSVTLSNAFGDSHNATAAVYGGDGADTRTPKSGWTELRDVGFTPTNNADLEVQFIASNDGSSTATCSGADRYGAVCVELGAQ